MKEAIMKFFKGFQYEKGDDLARGEIYSAYDELWDEVPGVQYVRECNGDMDKHAEIMLECLRKGEPYEMAKKDKEELEQLDKEGAQHDGFC